MKGFLRFMTYPSSKRDGWMYFFFWGSGEFGINAAGKGGGFFLFYFFLGPAFGSATVDLEYDTV